MFQYKFGLFSEFTSIDHIIDIALNFLTIYSVLNIALTNFKLLGALQFTELIKKNVGEPLI